MAESNGTAVIKYEEVRRAGNLPAEFWPDDRIRAVITMLAPEARTPGQAALFLSTCNRYGLDPTLGEAWLGQIRGKPTVLTGRDSYIKIAQRDPNYAGFTADVVREKDEFTVTRTGEVTEIEHRKQGFGRGRILGAYALVFHKGRAPVYVEKHWDELSHLTSKEVWKQNGAEMVLTRALTFALKLQFNISGLYTQADEVAEEDQDAAASERAASATRDKLATLKDRMQAPPGEGTGGSIEGPPQQQSGQTLKGPEMLPAPPAPSAKPKREKTSWQRAHDGFFAAIKEHCPDWGDMERRLWSEQHGFPVSSNDWTEFQFKEAVQMLKRGETEVEYPRPEHEQPEPVGPRSPFDDDADGLPA